MAMLYAEGLAAVFCQFGQLIKAHGGVKALMNLSIADYNEMTDAIECDDFEKRTIIQLIRFMRDPTIDIDDVLQELIDLAEVEDFAMLFASERIFTPRYMNEMRGSAYFELYANNINPTEVEIVRSWLTDLRNGLYLIHMYDLDIDNVVHEVIAANDLTGLLQSIPSSMIELAELI